MSFRDAGVHLRDILESISLIEEFVGTMSFDAYVDDLKTKSAVERQMQIITEAAYRLGDDADTLCPGPNWKGYMGMGNILRHGYHKVDDRIVWDTVQIDLPSLKEFIRLSLESSRDAER